ncbi:MAG: tRNA (N6-threonylcarbamoyladenosine(37)-N6)-methyltransferase TrmO [Candidatus Latescibacteria bacterium]|nr:tRNA (N6-threonylcarbamoyladenosine(37)-N6)-methyltransferase TrmO [bacterium]MBD3423118.1 tRNA (N6-threonylcarbamoyladenosine(37)-N6)-methyltransferase TrmO [Candidatus Latescibacterota bacterium]
MVKLEPIGYLRSSHREVPNHWSISDLEGELVINPEYAEGLSSIRVGDLIVVIFEFHKSPPFTADKLKQKPPHRDHKKGVFSICSPKRPNPLGLSVVEVLEIERNVITVSGIDMLDGTPILDIKPHITS